MRSCAQQSVRLHLPQWQECHTQFGMLPATLCAPALLSVLRQCPEGYAPDGVHMCVTGGGSGPSQRNYYTAGYEEDGCGFVSRVDPDQACLANRSLIKSAADILALVMRSSQGHVVCVCYFALCVNDCIAWRDTASAAANSAMRRAKSTPHGMRTCARTPCRAGRLERDIEGRKEGGACTTKRSKSRCARGKMSWTTSS
jgi:hypothetical protein